MRILLLLIPILLYGCANTEEFVIELKLQEGETYWQETTNITTTSNNMPMMTSDISNTTLSRLTFRVDAVEDDLFYMTASYDNLELIIEGEDEFLEEMEFVLERTRGLGDKMKNWKFNLTMNTSGEVLDLEGFENFKEGMSEYIQSFDPEEQVPLTKVLGFIDESFFMESMTSSMSFYPPSPRKIGDSWTSHIAMESLLGMTVNYEYTLVDLSSESFFIDLSGTIDMDTDSGFFSMLKGMGDVEFAGEVKGRIEVNREHGWLTQSELTQKSVISIKMPGFGNGDESSMETVSTMVSRIKGGMVD